MKKTIQEQEDKKPCKNCGGTGKLWSTERSYPCPDCCQSEAQTEQKKCICRCHLPLVTTHLCPNCFNEPTLTTPMPQPTDGLLQNWEKDAEVFMSRWPDDEIALEVLESWLKDLLAEQKTKTREDTLNNIEAIWTRLLNETDDPVKKDVYANCIKALKI